MDFIYTQLFVTPTYPTTSCAGQTIIVTGSNVGLGKEAARHFARLGAAKLILAVRNTQAGEAAKQDIESTTNCSKDVIEVWPLDLASYESIRAFAARASSSLPRIDVLLENAGIGSQKWVMSGKHERMVAVNVIGTFYLALLMIPKLKESAKTFGFNPRLTIVSSETHLWTPFPEWRAPNTFDALNDREKTKLGERYPTTKLMEILIVRHLAPMLEGDGVVINCLNPGLCHSELGREGSLVLSIMKFFLARTTEVGGRTLVWSAVAGKESHGKYMTGGKVDETRLSKFAKSEEGELAGRKLWRELSEILEEIQPGVTRNI